MDKKLFWREFWVLWGLGIIADAVGMFVSKLPVTPIASHLFLRGYDPHRASFVGFEIAEIVFELGIFVGVGLLTAQAIGLGAPLLEAWLRGERTYPALSSLLVPTLLVGVVVGALAETPNLRVFHPNREETTRQVVAFANSPDNEKAIERLTRLAGTRTTPASEALFDVAGAISAAPDRLFWISGFAWLLTRMRRAGPGSPGRGILLAAIFASAAISAAFYFASQSAFEAAIGSSFAGLLIPRDPRWVVRRAAC